MARKLLFVLLFCGAPAIAADPDYFPMQPGNIWIYRASGCRGGSALVLEIPKSTEFNGKTYFLLHGLPGGDYWLREDDNGSVLSYDPSQGQEHLWYAFGNPEGEV